jgi:iron-sulfur cluster assembly accessory protein
MISLTEIAAKNFKRIREDEELSEEIPLRVAVKGGGCAGYEYNLTFGESTKRGLMFESEGLSIVIDKKSHLVVDGLEIGWSTDLSAPGPRFENPKASSTCGCSTSFSIKQEQLTKPAWMVQ